MAQAHGGEGEPQERSRVPMWIGAVGHRALWPQHEPELRRAIREVLDDVERRWGALLEPRLLTSLAEGSDQLVAAEARARGWALGVPLPLPVALYERDFGTQELLETHRRLRQQAALVFDVGLVPGVSLDQVRDSGDARESQYARAGRVVAETCPIVIALWDGETRDRVGGTSEVIARILAGWSEEDDAAKILNPSPPKLVYHVWTPSRERPDITGIPFTWRLLPSPSENPNEDVGQVLAEVLGRLGELDADVGAELRARPSEHEGSAAQAISPEHAATLPPEIRELLRWYGIADSLALHFQRRVRSVLPWLLGIGVLALAAYEVSGHWPGKPPEGLGVFVLAFVAMMLAVKRIQFRAHERKFLDYRALGEGLRVQLFWRLCGLPDSVSEHYLRKHRGELNWIPVAIASLSLGSVFPANDDAGGAWPLARRRRLARDCWLERQRAFYAAKGRSAQRRTTSSNWIAYGMLWVALFIVGGLWLKATVFTNLHASDEVKAGLHIAVGILLAASAAFRYFDERRAHATHARHYELMQLLSSRALRAVSEDRDSLESTGATEVFREFGRESLSENGDWLLLHRERPLEVPPPA